MMRLLLLLAMWAASVASMAMATISYVGTDSTFVESVTSIAVSPLLGQANDLAIAVLAWNTNYTNVMTAPAGWSTYDIQTFGSLRIGVYTLILPGAPGTYTWSCDGQCEASLVVSIYRGTDLATPIEQSSINGAVNGTTLTATSVSAGAATDWLLVLSGFQTASGNLQSFVNGSPGGMAQRAAPESRNAGPSHWSGQWAGDKALSSSGATGDKAVTVDNTTEGWAAYQVILQEPIVPTATATQTPTTTPTQTLPTPRPVALTISGEHLAVDLTGDLAACSSDPGWIASQFLGFVCTEP